MSKSKTRGDKPRRVQARSVRGFRDLFADDLLLKQRMIDTVRRVYESFGYVPLETPSIEFVDVLGKFLPEAAKPTPDEGIFAFQNPDTQSGSSASGGKDKEPDPTDPDYWISLRYDLTAPLARVVAEYGERLPRPFRRYQFGPVWRYEKPGLGRFREFWQFDFDAVGVASVAADAEACAVICTTLEALGFAPGDYVVKVNDRKLMQGVLQACDLDDTDFGDPDSKAADVLRQIDKQDRLGIEVVKKLLGPGWTEPKGAFIPGVGLDVEQIDTIERFLRAGGGTRAETLDRLAVLLKDAPAGCEGIEELREVDALLTAQGYGDDRVVFDPTVIRGLSYYTGPVFEGVLTREVKDEKGRVREFGTVFGGGRYDALVQRFTGQKVPATGASIGVDRLLEAVKLLETGERRSSTADVLVTVMDSTRLPDYFRIAAELRAAGIRTELFLGNGRIGKQLKYADRTGIPVAVIAGGDEFAADELQVKDLRLGRELSADVAGHEEWKRERPAQEAVPSARLVARIREILAD